LKLSLLSKPHVKADGEKADYTRLRAHLNRYVARNTFDYFIHKDLGGFLRREIDFYIKNEVMHLDDVENETTPRVEQYLSKIKVIRRIASKIIAFLAQLEDFEKALWLKKKFVVETTYCVTLDRIPEEFLPAIAANDAQREEWVRLFSIDKATFPEDEENSPLFPTKPVAYSVPLTVEYLKANTALLIDTRFFDVSFTEQLLDAIQLTDSSIDGILVHSDNFQGLRLLGARFKQEIKCIYIDPPYNTSSSAIPYKNDYKHSSFASMLHDRLKGLSHLLSRDGAIFVSIDKTERTVLEHILDDVFGVDNRIEELIWAMNTNNSQAPNYSTNHEYVLVYAKHRPTAEQDRNMFREPKPGYEEVMELIGRLNSAYPPLAKIEKEIAQLYEAHRMELREELEAEGLEWEDEKGNDPWKGLYNYCHAEYRDASGRLVSESEAKKAQAKIWVWRESDASMPATKQAASTRDVNHKNYRFYRPEHPATHRPAPHPKSGWKFAYDDDQDSPDRRSFVSLDRDGRIAWGADETKIPQVKRMLHEVETNVGKSVFTDYSDGEKQTSAMFGQSGLFLSPKHADFVSRFILHAAKSDSTIVDCFGGSGSTAHAVIRLNRSDRGHRKFILIEMAEYFDRVLKPRVLKAIYSPDWRAGKPISRQGISQCVKVIRLESYEDALNNLEVKRSATQQNLLDTAEAHGADKLREQYLLRYMLKVETRESPSLLNVAAFTDPTLYRLVVKRPGSDESRDVNVDLIETFNWLLGLRVQHIAIPHVFSAQFERDKEKRLRLKGRIKPDASGPYWFRTITGTTPDGRKTLVIWRKLSGKPEEDNLVLDEWFTKQGYSSKDSEFGLIYVNGGNNLENLKAPDDTWKVRLIEDDFQRLMFATEGQ
jgi:adenine-specific DNA-methyltransferase